MSAPKPIYIVDIIGEIVAKTSAIVTPKLQDVLSSIVGINYIYDTPKRIILTLTQMTKVDSQAVKKYPLVALFQPFNEKHVGNIGFDNQATLRLIIAHWTNDEDKSINRYEKVFKPILYPIYEELLNQIDKDKRINSYGIAQLQHTKTDWPYWAPDESQKANTFNDKLDIIEMKDLVLNFKLKNC